MDYSSYLKIDKLLTMQKTKSGYRREELLFIITHQATELWLKMLIVEIDTLMQSFTTNNNIIIVRHIDNCNTFVGMMIMQFQGLKRLSPLEFAKFREILGSASGIQSIQYKILNKILGITYANKGISQFNADENIYFIPQSNENLCEIVNSYILKQIKIKFPVFFEQSLDGKDSELQYVKALYDSSVEIQMIIDKLIELDEGLIKWRQEHVYLVKRMIGSKLGTGAESIESLNDRVNIQVFKQLWKLREMA